mmetsp:Transcript_133762/g.236814  ORF Transcript_133762/g.236814 Transcript_133762/m.236814 type:complete len:278 (-) Transcript_133762:367-1200(-)
MLMHEQLQDCGHHHCSTLWVLANGLCCSSAHTDELVSERLNQSQDRWQLQLSQRAKSCCRSFPHAPMLVSQQFGDVSFCTLDRSTDPLQRVQRCSAHVPVRVGKDTGQLLNCRGGRLPRGTKASDDRCAHIFVLVCKCSDQTWHREASHLKAQDAASVLQYVANSRSTCKANTPIVIFKRSDEMRNNRNDNNCRYDCLVLHRQCQLPEHLDSCVADGLAVLRQEIGDSWHRHGCFGTQLAQRIQSRDAHHCIICKAIDQLWHAFKSLLTDLAQRACS